MDVKKIAKWKDGFSSIHNNADAQKVADEIMGIGETATPQQIVDRARDESSELHKCFEWDNDVAAEKWRLQQARMVVCHLVIKEERRIVDQPEIRYFHIVEKSEGYKPTEIIYKNPDEYEKLLANAVGELRAIELKYKSLSELELVFEAIHQIA